MVSEFAVWADAMRARCDLRFRPLKHGPSCCHDDLAAGHETLRVRRHISIEEADGWITRSEAQRALDVADDDGRDANAAALQHPGLGRDITDLVGFDAAAVLDFDQAPAAPIVGFKDVGTNNHALPPERRFKDRQPVWLGQELSSAGDCGRYLEMGFCDQVAMSVTPSRHFADRMPTFEQRKGVLVELPELAAMNLEPQAARAMLKGGDLAFGQARLRRCR